MAAKLRHAILLGILGLFILFLYGPTLTILVLSFQGPDGGLTFPMNGVSTHWFARLFEAQAVGDFGGSLIRSFSLATMVMILAPVVVSLAAGIGFFRRRFRGSGPLFTLTVASLIIPSILVSLGVGLLFNALGLDPDLVQFRVRRPTHLDPAVRPAHHVRRLQPLQSGMGGSRPRPGRHPMAIVPPCGPADHRPQRHRHRAIRLHSVLRRIRPHPADRRQRQHPARWRSSA